MDFSGKTVLVTGGAVRIGAALVRGFAAAGARVLIHARHSLLEAEALAKELPAGKARVVALDLADAAAVGGFFAGLGEKVDVLINNASLYSRDLAASEGMLQVNCHAPVSLIRQFAGQCDDGAAVNILDQEIAAPVPQRGAYSESKRALAQATRPLALELAPRIRVNGIAPGPVLPPVWLPAGRMEKTIPTLPLRRPVALADLVEATMMLAANRSITGAILFVDCGQSLTS